MKLTKHVFTVLMAGTISLGVAAAQNNSNGQSSAAGSAADQTTSGKTTPRSTTGSASSNSSGSSATGNMSGKMSGSENGGHVAGAAGDSGSMVSATDRKFMEDAARGGMAEVQLAQMAQQKASRQEVKDYARKLEQDHTQANDKLKSIAQQRQIQLSTDIGEHQQMVSRLSNLSGDEFDRAYMRMMVQDHKKDIKEFQRESNRSIDSDLKEFASTTLPTLQQHLQSAEQINSSTRSRKADRNSSASASSTSGGGSSSNSSTNNSSSSNSSNSSSSSGSSRQ
jgi:putative membrane protein